MTTRATMLVGSARPPASPLDAVVETAIIGQRQHDFERLNRDENERADQERRACHASLDRVLADVSQSADFGPVLNDPMRSFIAYLEALRDEIDGDRLWLRKDGLKVQISACGVAQDQFERLGYIPQGRFQKLKGCSIKVTRHPRA